MNPQTRFAIMDSPLGRILLAGSPSGLSHIHFQEGDQPLDPDSSWREDAAFFTEPIAQLEAYLAGRRTEFNLQLAPGGTPFQERVWRAVRAIPYGSTSSYGDLARQLGQPAAVRAVGAANGRNPLPIVVPCHRVIGSDGSLTGYAGGLHLKRWLLQHERRTLGQGIQRATGRVFHQN